MKTKSQDIIIGFIILIGCACFFYVNRNLSFGSGVMPRFLLILMSILGVLIVLGGIEKTKEGNIEEFISFKILKVPVKTYLFIVGYIILFRLVGYFIATPIFLFLLIGFFREKSKKLRLIVTGIYLLIIYFVFVGQLKVAVADFGLLGKMIGIY